jgi:hypothetical protein
MKRFPKTVLLNIRGAELKDAPQLQNFSTHTNLLLWEFGRVALNHIVDVNEDGSLTVTYFTVFIRVTRTAEMHLLKDKPMHDSNIGLPTITTFSRAIDKIKKDKDENYPVLASAAFGRAYVVDV